MAADHPDKTPDRTDRETDADPWMLAAVVRRESLHSGVEFERADRAVWIPWSSKCDPQLSGSPPWDAELSLTSTRGPSVGDEARSGHHAQRFWTKQHLQLTPSSVR